MRGRIANSCVPAILHFLPTIAQKLIIAFLAFTPARGNQDGVGREALPTFRTQLKNSGEKLNLTEMGVRKFLWGFSNYQIFPSFE